MVRVFEDISEDELKQLIGWLESPVVKRYQQLTYLARRLREGKASGADLDKLVEAVVALVDVGLPPSSIRLRDVLEIDAAPPRRGGKVAVLADGADEARPGVASQRRQDRLQIDWGRLQIEQSTWAMHARIEKIATRDLGMRTPPASRVQVVSQPEAAK